MMATPLIFIFSLYIFFFFFFFNDTATTEIYTLSLHDALPILGTMAAVSSPTLTWAVINDVGAEGDRKSTRLNSSHLGISYAVFCLKTEEHTSELQSLRHLVCRLLLEKKYKS